MSQNYAKHFLLNSICKAYYEFTKKIAGEHTELFGNI